MWDSIRSDARFGTDAKGFSKKPVNPGRFFAELKRRNVYKVVVANVVD